MHHLSLHQPLTTLEVFSGHVQWPGVRPTILDEEGVVIAAKDARNRANDDVDNGGVYVRVGQAIEEDQDEGLGLKYGHVYVIRTHLLFCTFIF